MDAAAATNGRTDAHAEHKTLGVLELRAAGDDIGPGEFKALVAVFGNIDSYGDRIMPGAFTRTLKPPPEGRGLPPIVWAHGWDIPPIGTTLAATETDRGLEIHGRLLVGDGEDHPTARAVYAAMRAQGGDGRPPLREFSFGFETRASRMVTETKDGADGEMEVRELLDIELFEAGPVLVGANPATQLDRVKGRDQRTVLMTPGAAAHPAVGAQLDALMAKGAEMAAQHVKSQKPPQHPEVPRRPAKRRPPPADQPPRHL